MSTGGWIFGGKVPEGAFEVVVNLESWANHATQPRRELRLDAAADAVGFNSHSGS